MLKMWKMVYPVYAFLHVLSLTGAFRILVQECPVTETAWQARSQMFECKSPLVYHCIQDNVGKLMETCMRAYHIKPFYEVGCPWALYSTYDSILSSIFYPCEENGCPQKNDSDYWSNQLYKYPICLHYKETTEITALPLKLTIASNTMNESNGIIIAMVFTAISMNVVLIVILIVWNYRGRLNSPTRDMDVEADVNLRTPLISSDERTELTKMLIKFQGNGHQSESSEKGISKTIIPYLTQDHYGQTLVHKACFEGKTSLVKDLIRTHGDIFCNLKDNKGMTLLHSAGFSGSVELVQYLLENGCDFYSRDNDGQTIVHIACQEGHISLLKYLTDIDKHMIYIKDKNGMTAFHCAGHSGSVELVKYLIDIGTEVCCQDLKGQTIAHIACGKGHVNLMKYLIDIDKGVLKKEDKNGFTPFHFAGLSASVELVQYLRDNGCDIYSKSSNGQTIVHIACGKGHVKLMKYLRALDRDVLDMEDNNGSTPFHFAGCSGSVKLVRYLVDKGCDIYSKGTNGQTIAHTASGKGHLNLMRYLTDLDKGILEIRDNDGLTPFHFAGCSGSVELVQYFYDEGCDIYSKETNGQTIAHIACGKGHLNLMRYLTDLDKGILKVQDNDGLTPFHFAGFSGSVELVRYLVDKGCDIHSKSTNGQTIAHIACAEEFVNLMEYLIGLDKGILEIQDNNGFTPFHFARFSGSVKLTDYLMFLMKNKNVTEVDTDMKEIDKDGMTVDKDMIQDYKSMFKGNTNVMDIM